MINHTREILIEPDLQFLKRFRMGHFYTKHNSLITYLVSGLEIAKTAFELTPVA